VKIQVVVFCVMTPCSGRIPTFRRTMLSPSSGWSALSRKVYPDVGPSHRSKRSPRTFLFYHINIWRHNPQDHDSSLYPRPIEFTLKMDATGPPKRWYTTASLHGVITKKTATWISIQAPFTSPWRWTQHSPPKRWNPITSLHGVITQKT
jgi:hypothetical protein